MTGDWLLVPRARFFTLLRKVILIWMLDIILVILSLVSCNYTNHPNAQLEKQSEDQVQKPQRYSIHQNITLKNVGEKTPEQQNLWVALIRDISPYQSVVSRTIYPQQYEIFVDEFGNQYAEFNLEDHPAGTTIPIDIEYTITVYEQIAGVENCEGELIAEFTEPELHIESANPQIVRLSETLSEGKPDPCAKLRSFYDYIGDELVYTYNHNDWGAQAALGPMGADCTEYASLMIALSRAAGIPARYIEGLLYLNNLDENTARTEHAWLEAYLPGTGWAAMDPTLGRPLSKRDDYFGRHTTDHIIVTVGRNPSTLRGSSYWSHLYWPGDSTLIQVENAGWEIIPLD